MLHRHRLIVTVVAAFSCSIRADVVFVDDDAQLGGDGLGWNTAYQFLQDALADAVGGTEIRVAQGVYTPDRDESGNVIPGDPLATFQLISDVSLMGGYAGVGAPDPDARDIGLYETILSGDLLGNDGPDFQDNDENSLHVVSATGVSGVHVDGFTITAGNAHAPGVGVFPNGGGMRIRDSTLAVTRCRFTGNSAEGGGGGVSARDSDVVFTGCMLQHNRALRPTNGGGGALVAIESDVALEDCAIIDNMATAIGGGVISAAFDEAIEFTMINCQLIGNSAGFGGGLTIQNVVATVIDCTFAGNEALHSGMGLGGGVQQNDGVVLSMINSLVADNFAAVKGGGIWVSGQLTMANCTVARNTAGMVGGGIDAEFGVTGSVRNSILWENSAAGVMDEAAQIDLGETELISVDFSCVQGLTGMLGGSGNIDADPLFVDPLTGDYRLSPDSPCIDAGHNWGVPPDTADVDNDGDVRELTPLDLDGNPRFVHAAVGTHPGCGIPAVVDMGAYEFQDGKAVDIKLDDIDGDGTVNIIDLLILLASWGSCEPGCCLADLDIDGDVGITDFLRLLGNWG